MFVEKPPALVVVDETESQEALIAMSRTLRCSVDSNPKALVIWLRNDDEVVSVGVHLNLSHVAHILSSSSSPEQKNKRHLIDGHYTCRVRTPNFADLTARTTIVTRGPPHIAAVHQAHAVSTETVQPSSKSTFRIENNEALVEFHVMASPPLTVSPIVSTCLNNTFCTSLRHVSKIYVLRHMFILIVIFFDPKIQKFIMVLYALFPIENLGCQTEILTFLTSKLKKSTWSYMAYFRFENRS